MAKKSFEDSLEEQLLRFTQGPVKDLLAEARAPVGQTDRTVRPDSPAEQIDRTVEPDRLSEQSNRTDRIDSPGRQTGESDRPVGQTARTVEPDSPIDLSDRTVESDCPTQGLVKVVPRSGMTTPGQKAVFRYFQINGSHVSTYEVISQETRVPRGTVRAVVRKLEGMGYLTKRDWWQGNTRAISFTFRETGQTDRTDRPDSPVRHTDQTDRQPFMKIDRRENLSISQERVELTWPNLAAAGFGQPQLEQIHRALEELGKPKDKVVQSLDHAEWELENGKMVDKTGAKVSDPCSWVFRSLARTGYYRKPAGYVSPEEQALIDEAEVAKAVHDARQAAEDARFVVWKEGLSQEEMDGVMVGFPGGSKDAWLKKQWRRLCAKAPGSS